MSKFQIVQGDVHEWLIFEVDNQEQDQKNENHQSLTNDSVFLEEDLDDNQDDLPVHDHYL
eukprot:CAMPEP_0170552518 /NCGR_PEP_ID=MMETSP0211-20121228/10392_1 /TAXON_ID=311385 /ORGANISM="Pseudokeronopsis sp., Strain OXSARD2" /LENGTH=59 /DNA_ID=CAMNT_0010860269 /DNA_START=1416 /DNA_END=1593 /DNA_ORIENTATION=-